MKKKIQIALGLTLIVVTARTAYILYERHAEQTETRRKQAPPLDQDYYVTPKKLYPYDLKSARQLMQQPVWVKVGYAYTYYPYAAAAHRVDFAHEAGRLPPIEKLKIEDVITTPAPAMPNREVMAVFAKDRKTYAFSIGTVSDGNFQIYSDDMLYIQDPHELYKYWPADIWSAIDQHQVKTGMSELQTAFALGLGIPEGSGDSGDKTVDYANGGKPLTVTYRGGKVREIHPGT